LGGFTARTIADEKSSFEALKLHVKMKLAVGFASNPSRMPPPFALATGL